MIKADLSQGTLEALQISRSPVSHLPEELTVCYPSMCGLRKITYESEKCVGSLNFLQSVSMWSFSVTFNSRFQRNNFKFNKIFRIPLGDYITSVEP